MDLFEQLRDHVEVDLRGTKIDVSQESRQERQLSLDVLPLSIPAQQAVYRKSMAERMKARPSPSWIRFYAYLASQLVEDSTDTTSRQRLSMIG
jgi:hypothetical protein